MQVESRKEEQPPICTRCDSGLRTYYGEQCAWCPDRTPTNYRPHHVPSCSVHQKVSANWGAPGSDPQRCWNCRKPGDVHLVNPCKSCRSETAMFGPLACVPVRCRDCRLIDSDTLRNGCQRCGIYKAAWGGLHEGPARCLKCRQIGSDRLRTAKACHVCGLHTAHWGSSSPRTCRQCRQPGLDAHYFPIHRRCGKCGDGPVNKGKSCQRCRAHLCPLCQRDYVTADEFCCQNCLYRWPDF